MNDSQRNWLLGVLAVVVLLLLSLSYLSGEPGEKLGRVSGSVTFDGKPVTEGLVIFQNPAKGIYMTDEVDAEGRYEIIMAQGAGLPLGEYQVSVSPPLPKTPELGDIPGRPSAADQFPNIPQRYRDPQTSGLALVVEEGSNHLDIAMTTK